MCSSSPDFPDPLPPAPVPEKTAEVVRTSKKLQGKKRRAIQKGAAQLRIPLNSNIGGVAKSGGRSSSSIGGYSGGRSSSSIGGY